MDTEITKPSVSAVPESGGLTNILIQVTGPSGSTQVTTTADRLKIEVQKLSPGSNRNPEYCTWNQLLTGAAWASLTAVAIGGILLGLFLILDNDVRRNLTSQPAFPPGYQDHPSSLPSPSPDRQGSRGQATGIEGKDRFSGRPTDACTRVEGPLFGGYPDRPSNHRDGSADRGPTVGEPARSASGDRFWFLGSSVKGSNGSEPYTFTADQTPHFRERN